MIKIGEAFKGKKAFIAYLMAGDPDLDTSAEYILTVQEAGADLIEIGIPFSDPIAEGEVIQAASERALRAGTRIDGVFEMVDSIKERMRVPMVFMTYANLVFAYGYDRFFAHCADVGIAGIIIPDIPLEEQAEVKVPANKYGVEVITMVAPTSESRIAKIAEAAEGFVYVVSSMGVTGMRSEIDTDISAIISKIKGSSDVPVAVGFGISTPEQAKQFSKIADGVIVGSAIVRIIAQQGTDAKQALHDYVKGMKKEV
jgi:tryptophan synthase alpha chain